MRLVARVALLSAAGGLAGFAGAVAGVVYLAREAEKVAMREAFRALVGASKLEERP